MAGIWDRIMGRKPHALYGYPSLSTCTAFTPNLAVVGVRAFTTSQSAEAHVILFQRIFDFATEDTKIPVRFNHIHGGGFLLWIGDAHMGQALGINSAWIISINTLKTTFVHCRTWDVLRTSLQDPPHILPIWTPPSPQGSRSLWSFTEVLSYLHHTLQTECQWSPIPNFFWG